MAKADKEDLAAQAAKRAEFRLHHVGTKLSERELGALDGLLAQRGQSQGEFIRGLILAEIERDRQGVRASVELEEITAIRLLLINLLRPVATGQPMPEKTFDGYIAEVKKRKAGRRPGHRKRPCRASLSSGGSTLRSVVRQGSPLRSDERAKSARP
jgi:hypothetical protein